jgi:hypothetical protein
LNKRIDELTKKKDEIELREIKHREELNSMREEMNQQFTQIMSIIQQNPQLAYIKPEVLAKKIEHQK